MRTISGRQKFLIAIAAASLVLGFAGNKALACGMPITHYVPLDDFPGKTGLRNHYEYIQHKFRINVYSQYKGGSLSFHIPKYLETTRYFPVTVKIEKMPGADYKCKRLALILESDLAYRDDKNRLFQIKGHQTAFDVTLSKDAECYFRTTVRTNAEKTKLIAIAIVEDASGKRLIITKGREVRDSLYWCYGTMYVRTKKRARFLNAQ